MKRSDLLGGDACRAHPGLRGAAWLGPVSSGRR